MNTVVRVARHFHAIRNILVDFPILPVLQGNLYEARRWFVRGNRTFLPQERMLGRKRIQGNGRVELLESIFLRLVPSRLSLPREIRDDETTRILNSWQSCVIFRGKGKGK